MELNGQHILITGASKGIGIAIAEDLLEKNASVAIHYNTGKEEAEHLANKYTNSKAFGADLEDLDSVEELFKKSLVHFGSFHTLILNAAVFIPHQPELTTGEWMKIWRKTMTINLDATALLTKLAIDHFRSLGEGRLVYIGSRAAFRGETKDYLAYAASKGGITSLARSVARSFGKDNIKSFVIAPGFTRTKMAEKFIKKHGEQRVLDEIALNTLTTPKDIAPVVSLICKGQLDHATGTTIDINAGSYMH